MGAAVVERLLPGVLGLVLQVAHRLRAVAVVVLAQAVLQHQHQLAHGSAAVLVQHRLLADPPLPAGLRIGRRDLGRFDDQRSHQPPVPVRAHVGAVLQQHHARGVGVPAVDHRTTGFDGAVLVAAGVGAVKGPHVVTQQP
ncbi:hypothetical protein F4561_003500 [Lipingzhangella halophila]|uniref:Uncharacterized protein n=1 Tax=Lipingzhangella halophila TaxID=1783352 RepID=A0A7W7RIM5_9ACTN|nr:hypothetical protein [Lipingzhangella halophila]MBB4932680.1 hypothetical protein [Lipingzhangella halophila]